MELRNERRQGDKIQENRTRNERLQRILAEIKKVIVGKDEVIERVLQAILAQGHILIEDIPGVGKTTLALAVSRTMQLDYRRMQFTPDVLPSDVVGFQMYGRGGEGQYHPGSIMCNLFLADEINRTSAKTQSALLEVMEEGSVTVDGVTRELPKPFTVIATQNPVGSVGTQMLPESQMDRFMVRLSMGYPDMESEIKMLKERHARNPMDTIGSVIDQRELLEMQREVEQVFVHDEVYEYIAKLIGKTRENPMLNLGISPRGTLALVAMTKAAAYWNNREYCLPDDVTSVFAAVTSHRMLLSPKARVNHTGMQDVIEQILSSVKAPW